jgi:DNA-binding transcriptional ArsR family regulator
MMADGIVQSELNENDESVAETLSTESELEERRWKVAGLRLRRLSLAQISRALGVSMPTVSRDLAWIRAHRQEVYGATPTLDAAQVLGESLALYEDVQATALRYAQSVTLSVRDRLRCMHTAMVAREKMTVLLQDVGLLNRAAPDLTIGLPTAAQIRQALELARPEQTELVFEPEQTWQRGEGDDVCAAGV